MFCENHRAPVVNMLWPCQVKRMRRGQPRGQLRSPLAVCGGALGRAGAGMRPAAPAARGLLATRGRSRLRLSLCGEGREGKRCARAAVVLRSSARPAGAGAGQSVRAVAAKHNQAVQPTRASCARPVG